MSKKYLGTSFDELCKGKGPWNFYIPPIAPSKQHTVLYEINSFDDNYAPKPHRNAASKHWDENHVKMPYSEKNVIPLKSEDGKTTLASRWQVICDAYSKPIKSIAELETAINKYHQNVPKLIMLEYLFQEVFTKERRVDFFENTLPKIISLALRLPEILPGNLPLLKKNQSKSVTLSQVQVSCLLANAFLCTFPWSKEVSTTYPGVNFTRLYSYCQDRSTSCVMEKVICIIHYFERITQTVPTGVITIERIFLHNSSIPRWNLLEKQINSTKLHITVEGVIEEADGFLQVDFANKNVGGGVLGGGCVQEEIRFVICPELLVTRLIVEQLGDTEAVIVRGIERYSKYVGYGETFKWSGNYVDKTPLDPFGRRQTAVCIIDATLFFKAEKQYYSSSILRELCKAYVGFFSRETERLSPVASGNWGCGAFGGDARLKSLIQLIACSATNRDLVYYTFGNASLQEEFYNIYLFLTTNNIKTNELWSVLGKFVYSKLPSDKLYSFIQQSFLNKRSYKTEPVQDIGKFISKNKTDTDVLKKVQETATTSKTEQKFITEPKLCDVSNEKIAFNEVLFEENHNDILNIFKKIDSPVIGANNPSTSKSLLIASEEYKKEIMEKGQDDKNDAMDIDETIIKRSRTKNKITDYFSRLGKS